MQYLWGFMSCFVTFISTPEKFFVPNSKLRSLSLWLRLDLKTHRDKLQQSQKKLDLRAQKSHEVAKTLVTKGQKQQAVGNSEKVVLTSSPSSLFVETMTEALCKMDGFVLFLRFVT